MNDKIISALISASGPIIAAIITGIYSKNITQTLIVFGFSLILVAICIIIVLGTNNKSKVKILHNEIDTLNGKNIELKSTIEKLNSSNKEIMSQLDESNATIIEVDRYLNRSHITIPSIIKSTINEHHYLSKPAYLIFEYIHCSVTVTKNNSCKLYDTNFKWEYKGSRELACTDFLIDVFSTTNFSDAFLNSLNIQYLLNDDWYNLEEHDGYELHSNKDDNHRIITIDLTKIPSEDFNITIEYTLEKNYDFSAPEETFVFMPFIYSNARNSIFICDIDMGLDACVENATIIKSPKDEIKTYNYNSKRHRVFHIENKYESPSDFKNVTINIKHIKK